jgi:transcriptional regulator of arginine metabolism
MTDTASRRRMLHRLLTGRSAASQAELVRLLADAGFPVTQATVSRDLAALGAAKVVAGDGREIYRPVAAPAPATGPAGRALAIYALSITASANLVVIKTRPGAAPVVAGTIDAAPLPGVIGTVAGDDTVLVVAADGVSGHTLAAELERSGAGP